MTSLMPSLFEPLPLDKQLDRALEGTASPVYKKRNMGFSTDSQASSSEGTSYTPAIPHKKRNAAKFKESINNMFKNLAEKKKKELEEQLNFERVKYPVQRDMLLRRKN